MRQSSLRFAWLVVVALAVLPGCATVNNPTDPRDPLEPINRAIYHFNDVTDHLVMQPVAQVYRDVLPPIVRTGVSNFFSNINDVLVALNNLLQGKPQNAVSDAGRVVVNSTIGILGIFDVATKMGLEKHDEDFGQTLGYWGIGDGPFLMLPFFGPSNFRDAVGRIGDFYTDPVTYVNPPHDRNILWGTRIISRRAELLGSTQVLETAALDPYAFLRDAYLQRRRNLIYDGNPPPEPEDEGEDTKSPPAGGKPKGEQPRSDGQSSVPVSRLDAQPASSNLVSGEALTPAEQEALENARRPAANAAAGDPVHAAAVSAPGAAGSMQ